MTCQSFWIILFCLPDKGIEELVEKRKQKYRRMQKKATDGAETKILLNPDIPDQLVAEEANWSDSALFVI